MWTESLNRGNQNILSKKNIIKTGKKVFKKTSSPYSEPS